MSNIIKPKQGDIYTNSDLMNLFKCSRQGGIRYSKKTKSLVLITNHIESIYMDKWVENTLHYVGTGSIGDQNFNYKGNKHIYESTTNEITMHLFEVFTKGEYTYQGIVRLSGKPYKEKQLDNNSKVREVCIFPLRLVNGYPTILNPEQVVNEEERRFSELYQLPIEEIRKLIDNSSNFESPIRKRNIILYARKRADGKCQLCEKDAPFKNKKGIPFLEVHHIKYLSDGGSDTIDNVVALCPNCHRKIHFLEESSDVEKLRRKAQ